MATGWSMAGLVSSGNMTGLPPDGVRGSLPASGAHGTAARGIPGKGMVGLGISGKMTALRNQLRTKINMQLPILAQAILALILFLVGKLPCPSTMLEIAQFVLRVEN